MGSTDAVYMIQFYLQSEYYFCFIIIIFILLYELELTHTLG